MTAEEQGAVLAQLGAPFSPNEIKSRVIAYQQGRKKRCCHPIR